MDAGASRVGETYFARTSVLATGIQKQEEEK
jgi:hypothetical protein